MAWLREKGYNHLAFMFANTAKSISIPKTGTLFVECAVYNYLIDYEISIIAYYIPGAMAYGKLITQQLLTRSDIAPVKYARTEKNTNVILKYYQML